LGRKRCARAARRGDARPGRAARLPRDRRNVGLLAVRDLSAFYGDFQALFGISLEVGEGETVAVIGANGAGKTTFLRTLAGALPGVRGAIELDGQAVGGRPAHALVELGSVLVPEGRKHFPRLSVRGNLPVG